MGKAIPPRLNPCSTCVFTPGAFDLAPGRLEEIKGYLIAGRAHVCHSPGPAAHRRLVCRGGRDFQLLMWHRMGIIAAPTDGALRVAMAAAGVEPAPPAIDHQPK